MPGTDKSRFAFNDENKYNCYGFRILNAGIDMARFEKNPVMLDQHWQSTRNVIGSWEDVKTEGILLSGVPVFDVADPDAKSIAGKVERGFIKACSMGILFDEQNMNVEGSGKYVLTKCELLEVSMVAVPGNANAVRLYSSKTGELMSDEQVKMSLSGLTDQTFFENKNTTMKKVILSVSALVALGLDKLNQSEGVDVSDIESAVNKIKQNSDALQLKLTAAEGALQKYTDAESARLNAEVDEFVKSVVPSKYDESERENITKLAKADLAFAKKMAALVPEKKTLSASINNPAPPAPGEVKTMEDFQKLSLDAQLAFKKENPAEYSKIVSAV